jgi:hypothetical protein
LFWATGATAAGEQSGIQRHICRQQYHEEYVDRAGHAAELGDADIDPVDAGTEQPQPQKKPIQALCSGRRLRVNPCRPINETIAAGQMS